MNHKKIFLLLIFLLILSGILFRVVSLDKDISAEEPDFVSPALAIKETGHPVHYNSELFPKIVSLWHPPTYIYLMSLIFQFSTDEIATRSINIIFSLLTAILIYIFCANIIGKEKGKIIGLISSAFFMINYYVFSSSVLIDIDILSMFFTLCFVYFILRYHQTKRKIYFYFSSIFLLFSIGNRYPMAFLVYGGIGIYYFFNEEFKKDFKDYLKIGIISMATFTILWGVYSVFIEPGNFFSFLVHNAKLGGEQIMNFQIYFGSFGLNLAQFIRLFTFPAVILMLWSIFYFWKRKTNLTRILLIYSLGTLIFFFLIPRPAFGYSRYFATIFPGLSILIGMFLYVNLKNFGFKRKEFYFMLSIFIGSMLLLIFLNPNATIYNSKGLIMSTNLPDFLMNLFASMPIFSVFIFKKEKRKIILILILLALTLSYSLFFTIKTINYEPHIKEVSEYIIENTNENEIIMVPKAIGYYTGRKYHLNDNNKPKLDLSMDYLSEYFRKSWENPEMDDEFFWPEGIYSGLYSPIPPQEDLEKVSYVVKYYKVTGFEPETKIGEFYVYNI